jgi:ankyrin repeat protein
MSTQLHVALTRWRWDEARPLIEQEACMRRRLMKSGARELPLHLGLSAPSTNAPPDDVVLKLLTQFPAASSSADCNGDLPLHLAVRCRTALPVLERIAAEYTPAFRARNTASDLPLQVAVKQLGDQDRCPFETIAWLVKHYPEACGSVDGAQELPLHEAARTGAIPATIRLLIHHCPAACREGDRDGDWPLHSAVRSRASLEVVTVLLEAEPSVTQIQCSRGQLPLHVGIVSGARLDVLVAVVDVYPSAVRQRDRAGDLPLHLAMEHGPLELVERLLLAYPESVQEPNRSGVMPVRHARGSVLSQLAPPQRAAPSPSNAPSNSVPRGVRAADTLGRADASGAGSWSGQGDAGRRHSRASEALGRERRDQSGDPAPPRVTWHPPRARRGATSGCGHRRGRLGHPGSERREPSHRGAYS